MNLLSWIMVVVRNDVPTEVLMSRMTIAADSPKMYSAVVRSPWHLIFHFAELV